MEQPRGQTRPDFPKGIPGLVSIVMPAYNCEESIAESINSVIAQTYSNWELLVVDDASADKTLLVADSMAEKESRIRVIRQAANGGVANARNVGMQAACGQYLAFLDSDDLWLPEKLAKQTEFMRRHRIAFSFTKYRRLKPDGTLGPAVRIATQVAYNDLLKTNVIGCLTVMLDRDKLPPFAMRAVGHEDYIAWLGILKTGYTAWGLPEDLARYRVSPKSLSGNKHRSALWRWRIYREFEQIPLAKALWYFAHYSLGSIYRRLIDASGAIKIG